MKIVSQKFREVRHELTPDISRPTHKYAVDDGESDRKEVERGGYKVHPQPPPNSVTRLRLAMKNERTKKSNERLLILGYMTSGEPWNIGTK